MHPSRIRRIALGGRRTLVSTLSFALLAAGVSSVGLIQRPVAGHHIPGTVLAAVQKTVIGSYSNSQARISVSKSVITNGASTVVAYTADVTLTDATALRSAFARNTFGRNITEPVSTTARNNNAVLAINTDYYGFRNDGIVIRNGVSYRDKPVRQGLGILRDGNLMLYDETKTSASQLLSANAWHALSFGPGLVQNGKILSGIDTYEIGDFGPVRPGALGSIQGKQPRTGIGTIGKNHFVMIVVDGRGAGGSSGVTMPEFAQLFIDAGAVTAFNLDGGGSSTMYFNGTVVNSASGGAERATSDILYVAR